MDIVIDQARLRRLLTKIEAHHQAKGWDEPSATYLIYDAALDRDTDLRYRHTFGLMYGIAADVEGYAAQPFLPSVDGHPVHQIYKIAKSLAAAQSPFDNSVLASASRAFIDLTHSPTLFAVAMCMEAWAVAETDEDANARAAIGRRTIADHPNAVEVRNVICVDLSGLATYLFRARGESVRIGSGPVFYHRVADVPTVQVDQPAEALPEGDVTGFGGVVSQSLGAILAAMTRRPVPRFDGVPFDSPRV